MRCAHEGARKLRGNLIGSAAPTSKSRYLVAPAVRVLFCITVVRHDIPGHCCRESYIVCRSFRPSLFVSSGCRKSDIFVLVTVSVVAFWGIVVWVIRFWVFVVRSALFCVFASLGHNFALLLWIVVLFWVFVERSALFSVFAARGIVLSCCCGSITVSGCRRLIGFILRICL